RFLRKLSGKNGLHFESPLDAAGHFLSLIKGVHHFRLLIGTGEIPDERAADHHARDVVALFLKAYRV
ncbi:MAG: TetR/AcrR family transcriptional regulator, partial [Pseudomonas sp.]